MFAPSTGRAARRAVSLLMLSLLAACGGGGGSGGGNQTPASSGLVPAAPAVGATLYSDASVFRPLRANAVWTYQGEAYWSDGTVKLTYVDIRSQTAGSGGAVTEKSTNLFNDGASASSSVSLQGGSIHSMETMEIVSGKPEQVDEIELRSPVRANDQYTVLDRHYDDLGIDADGDGKRDGGDAAIYKLVLGEETLDLPNLPAQKTVRVRTTLLLRAKYSSTGQYSNTVSATLDQWYAAGIGVVKVSTDRPGANGASNRQQFTQILSSWDGVSEGVGMLPVQTVFGADGKELTVSVSAAGFGDHALLMSFAGEYAAQGFVLSSLDGRGKVTASHTYPGLFGNGTLLNVGDQARVIVVTNSGVMMYSFDSNGQASGAPPVTLLTGPNYSGLCAGGGFKAASAGNSFWLAYGSRSNVSAENGRLMLQQFDANGQAIGAATAIAPVECATSGMTAASGNGYAAFTWLEGADLGYSVKNVSLDGTSTTPLTQTLAPAALPYFSPLALAFDGGTAALWHNTALAGVRFDAQGIPYRSTSGSVQQEFLAMPAVTAGLTPAFTNYRLAGASASANKIDTLLISQGSSPGLCVLAEFTPASGPLASNNGARALFRGDCIYSPSLMVSLNSNVLLITRSKSISIWRRP